MGHCLCGATGYIKISSGAYSERIPCSGCGHEAEIAALKAQVDQLLFGYPEGMTPTDVRVMSEANSHMADEIRRLQAEGENLHAKLREVTADLKACAEALSDAYSQFGDWPIWKKYHMDEPLSRPTIRQLLKD